MAQQRRLVIGAVRMMETATTKTASRFRQLITLNRIVAVLSIAAAIVLYAGERSLGIPALSAAPHHEPIIVHCLLTAGLLFYGNVRLRDADGTGWAVAIAGIFGSVMTAGVAVVDLWLAGTAFVNTNTTNAPVLLLIVPGVLCGWTFFASIADSEDPEQDDQTDDVTVEEVDKKTSVAAEASQATPELTLFVHFVYAVIYAVVYSTFLLVIAALAPYIRLLDKAVFDHQFTGWLAFWQELLPAIETISPYILIIAVGMFGIYGWGGITAYFRQKRDHREHRNFNRELDQNELALIDNTTNRLTEYITKFKNKWVYDLAALVIFLFALSLIFVAGFILLDPDLTFGASALEAIRTRGLEWYIYVDGFGVGDVALLIFGFAMALCSLFLVGGIWRELGIAGILDYRKDNENPEDPWSHYRSAIALEVRRGRLKPGGTFDAAALLHRDFQAFARGWYIFTAVLLAISLILLYLDRMDYDLLTEDYIETTDYWTSKVHRFAYGDVDTVEVTCAEDDDGDLELAYVLKIGKDRTIRAVDLNTPREFKNVLPRRLEAWTRVDAKLRAAVVPVRHAGFDAAGCRAGLAALGGEEMRGRVLPLLRESGGGYPP